MQIHIENENSTEKRVEDFTDYLKASIVVVSKGDGNKVMRQTVFKGKSPYRGVDHDE